MQRHAQLPHQEDIQLKPKRARNLVRHRHPATGEAEHDGVGWQVVLVQNFSEESPGFTAVSELLFHDVEV